MSEQHPWQRWWLQVSQRLRGEGELAGLPTSQQRAMARWQEEIVDQLEQAGGSADSAESLARLRADIQTISRAPEHPDAA